MGQSQDTFFRAAHDQGVNLIQKPTYRSILVYAGWSSAADNLVRCAVSIGNRFGARLYGVSTPALIQAKPPSRHTESDATLDGLILTSMELVEERFKDLTALAANGADWSWARLPVVEALERASHAADLILIHASYVWPRPAFPSRSFSSALTLGRPVLVAPWSCSRLEADHVAILWKEGAPTRRAVCDAMPFLLRAKTVSLIHVPNDLDRFDARERMEDVAQALGVRGVKTDVHMVPRTPGRLSKILVGAAMTLKPDLIVAGAYSRAPLERALTGSTTDALVTLSPVPLLLSR